MTAHSKHHTWALATVVVAAGLVAIGCNSGSTEITSETSKYEVAGDGDTSTQPSTETETDVITATGLTPASSGQFDSAGTPPKPSTTPPSDSVPAAPEDDSPAGLLAYIGRLNAQRPTTIPEFQAIQNQVIDAADQVIRSNATDEQQLAAANAKVVALTQLSQTGARDVRERLVAFTKELQSSKSAGLAKFGSRLAFANKMDQLANGTGGDPDAIVEDFKAFIETEEKNMQLLALGDQVVQTLQQAGHRDQAMKAYTLLADALSSTDDPQMTEAAAGIREVVRLNKADLSALLEEVYKGDAEAVGPFIEKTKELLSADGIGSTTFTLFRNVGPNLESTNPAAAKQLYAALGEAFADHPNAELAEQVKDTVTKFETRDSILGQPFNVEGATLDGQPFDWKKYQGKVVLVDFWATWCGPCLAEIPNIKENLAHYGEHGFEVVGVNLDDDPAELQKFMDYQKLPWPSVISSSPETRGWDHPMVEQCGVVAIPFMVLVDRNGKAVAVNARGDELDKQLAKLFPDVPPPAEPAASTPAASENAAPAS